MSTGGRAYRILKGYISREWDRVKGLERALAEEELERIGPETSVRSASEAGVPGVDPRARARRILGVPEDASFRTIHQAFTRLNRRADPKNFPAGSDGAQIAAQLRDQVHWAYRVLTEGMDNRERRFGSLEID
ncbi:MAG: hypothetical protein N2109_09455 [Fimbriimonadales bacterium]|nr:hypothetical protein [Fimbriimonadales bacterium]